MRYLSLVVLVVGMLALGACGSSSSGSNGGGTSNATIRLGFGQFLDTSATIKAGQAVKFDDSNGGQHNLVTGMNATFSQEAGAPSQFVPGGIPFSAGQVTTITFPTAGTYTIACTFHSSMLATITVTA